MNIIAYSVWHVFLKTGRDNVHRLPKSIQKILYQRGRPPKVFYRNVGEVNWEKKKTMQDKKTELSALVVPH